MTSSAPLESSSLDALPDPRALSRLSNEELHARTLRAARGEQHQTLVVLRHLREVSRRRLHLAQAYGSLFEYAVKALGYSEPAASERVNALRLLQALPEVEARMASGELTLTNAAAVQRFVRREEKTTSTPLGREGRERLVEAVSGQSTREAERRLLGLSAQPQAHIPRERERAVGPELTELKLWADLRLMGEITRVRELRGAELGLSEIFQAALGVYLEKIDPVRRPLRKKPAPVSAPPTQAPESDSAEASTPAPESQPKVPGPSQSRYVRRVDQSALYLKSGQQCEFTDSKTGRRCENRFSPQLDHRIPFARGGPTAEWNLRHYCGPHNRYAALQAYGEAKMRPFFRE